MLNIIENQSLKNFNTFGIEVSSRYFSQPNQIEDLKELLGTEIFKRNRKLIIGGGSNLLFTNNYDGIVVQPHLKGIEIVSETEGHIFIKAMAGEIWDDFVSYCTHHQWSGVENLSLIPGNIGSAPVQNIGAYGVELKDVFYCLEAIQIEKAEITQMDQASCQFGYRDSVFKNALKDQFIVVSVTFKLNKKAEVNVSYAALQEALNSKNILNPNLNDIRRTVCEIRQSKLPDPSVYGNAGSFFKNPTISASQYKLMQVTHPGIKAFAQPQGDFKISAGWMIESCGWKGYRKEDAGVHKEQALVLVNYGNATGKEILHLALEIRESVIAKFGVPLDMEVQVI